MRKLFDNRIVLFDGDRVAKLMVEKNVGVSVINRYELKKIDYDYFIRST
jgi:restriction system protein